MKVVTKQEDIIYKLYSTKKKADSQTIDSIIDNQGKQTFDNLNINNTFSHFYEKYL